jgi:hypothetical protein
MLILLAAPDAGTTAPSAAEIVRAADAVRNPGRPFRSRMTLTEFVSGRERDRTTLIVYSKVDPSNGQFRNLVRYVDPPRDSGKLVLLGGNTLWFFDPASNASVRISPQQRLLGQASIGDVLTVNLAIDYTAQLVGVETVQDAQRQARTAWHILLAPANDQAIYGRVEYWVEQATFRPVKARVFSDSGRLLKILYYRNFEERLGAVRPAEAVIIDSVDASLVTTARFDQDRWQDIPDAWFQRDSLPHLPAD